MGGDPPYGDFVFPGAARMAIHGFEGDVQPPALGTAGQSFSRRLPAEGRAGGGVIGEIGVAASDAKSLSIPRYKELSTTHPRHLRDLQRFW